MNNIEFDTLIENNIKELLSSFEYDYRKIIRKGLGWNYNILFIRFHRCLTIKDNIENQRRFDKLREYFYNTLNMNENIKIFFVYKNDTKNIQTTLYNNKSIDNFFKNKNYEYFNLLKWKKEIPNLSNEAEILVNL